MSHVLYSPVEENRWAVFSGIIFQPIIWMKSNLFAPPLLTVTARTLRRCCLASSPSQRPLTSTTRTSSPDSPLSSRGSTSATCYWLILSCTLSVLSSPPVCLPYWIVSCRTDGFVPAGRISGRVAGRPPRHDGQDLTHGAPGPSEGGAVRVQCVHSEEDLSGVQARPLPLRWGNP